MSEFFVWLSNNPAASITLIMAFGAIVGVLIVTYLIAFFQGREISFWPPKLGNRPETIKQKDNNAKSNLDYHQGNGDAKKIIELSAILSNHSIEHAKGWSSYNTEIIRNLENAKEVRILKIKGRDFYKEFPIKNALVDRVAAKKFTRILLQSPSSRFVTQNIASEYKWPDFESYMKDFIHSLEMLFKELPNYKDIVRLYDFLPLLKIYIFDDDIFVSIYSGKVDDKSQKEEVNVWHLSRMSNTAGIAQFIENFFDALWENTQPISLISNNTLVLNENTGSVLIPIRASIANITDGQKCLRNTVFSPKDEFHITIIGSKLGAILKEKMANHHKKDAFLQLLTETNWNYELIDQYFHLVKIEQNSDLLTNKEPRQSIIQIAHVFEIETFYKKVEVIFDIQIPERPAHITLYTTLADTQGIGIDTKAEFDIYSHGEIKMDELKDC